MARVRGRGRGRGRRTAAKSAPKAKARAKSHAKPARKASKAQKLEREEENPFEKPPPEGQGRIDGFVQRRQVTDDTPAKKRCLRRPAAGALEAGEEQEKEHSGAEPGLSEGPSNSPSSSSSSSSSSNSASAGPDNAPEKPARPALRFEDDDDAFKVPAADSGSGGNPLCSSPRRAQLQSGPDDDNASSLCSMFGFAARNVRRVLEGLGPESFARLCENLSGCTLLSLYSGLGGAELTVQGVWNAAASVAATRGSAKQTPNGDGAGASEGPAFASLWQELVAKPPRLAVSCDTDPSCQRVLFQHTSPPEFIVPDLCAFVDQSLLPQLEKTIGDARARVAAQQKAAAAAEKAEKAAGRKGKRKRGTAKKAAKQKSGSSQKQEVISTIRKRMVSRKVIDFFGSCLIC